MFMDEIERRAHESGVEPEEMLRSIVAAGLREDAPRVLNISVGPGSTVQNVLAALKAAEEAIPPGSPIFIEHVPPKN